MDLKKVQNITEEFWPGWWEAPVYVISKNDNLILLWLRSSFIWVWNTPVNDIVCWQDARFNIIIKHFFCDDGRDPITLSGGLSHVCCARPKKKIKSMVKPTGCSRVMTMLNWQFKKGFRVKPEDTWRVTCYHLNRHGGLMSTDLEWSNFFTKCWKNRFCKVSLMILDLQWSWK